MSNSEVLNNEQEQKVVTKYVFVNCKEVLNIGIMFIFYLAFMSPFAVCIGLAHKYCNYSNNSKFNKSAFNVQLYVCIPIMIMLTVMFIVFAIHFDYTQPMSILCCECFKSCNFCLWHFMIYIYGFIIIGPVMGVEYCKVDTKYLNAMLSKNNSVA